jgi:hypothetical protein
VQTAIRDERLPTAPELLGSAGLDLAAEVAAEGGGSVLSVEPTQALYSPGNHAIVSYEAEVTQDGGIHREVVAAVADSELLPPGAPVRRLGEGAVAAWRFPNDPVLSSLQDVLDEDSLADMMGQLELTARWVHVTPLVYRPTYRAVVRMSLKDDMLVFDRAAGRLHVRTGKRELYLKVVPPAHADDIRKVHDDLGRQLAVPHCHGVWSARGLLALEGLPGMTLRDFIRLRSEPPPSPDELVALLQTVDAAASTEDTVRSMRRRVRSHARLLRTILPDHEERIRRLGGTLRELLPSQRPAIIHGDFYDSQVMVDDSGSVTGLLDLDGVGWGDPADDMATMLGRVWTSAQTAGSGRERFRGYGGELLDGFSRHVDRRDLCLRVAAIVFGRCTAPFRSQAADWREQALERLELAELCCEHARGGELPA